MRPVLLKVSSILVVFCQNLVDHHTSEGLVRFTATMMRCLEEAGIASSFILGVEMRTDVASAFTNLSLLIQDTHNHVGEIAPIPGMRSQPV